MRYGTLPDVSGRVSRLVIGSMIFSIDNLERTFQLLDRFVEAGGTAIDTARVYAKGTSEQAFGAWLKARGLKPFSVSSPNLALAVPNEPMWTGCVTLAGAPEALDWYERSQMPVFAWSSQARGFFSGRYVPGMVGETTDQQNVIRTYFS